MSGGGGSVVNNSGASWSCRCCVRPRDDRDGHRGLFFKGTYYSTDLGELIIGDFRYIGINSLSRTSCGVGLYAVRPPRVVSEAAL